MSHHNRFICYLKVIMTLLLLSGLFAVPAAASFLSFTPSDQKVQPGNSVSVDILFSDPGGTIVGEYDFFVNYNPDILSFNTSDVVFGPGLGGGMTSYQDVVEAEKGRINISELSFGDPTTSQDSTEDLLLFTLTFDAGSVGNSLLSFSGNIDPDAGFLGDENGDLIPLDINGTANIEVVPIPGTVALMSFGLAALFGMRHKFWWRKHS